MVIYDYLMYHITNSVSIISKETQYLQHTKAKNMEKLFKIYDQKISQRIKLTSFSGGQKRFVFY